MNYENNQTIFQGKDAAEIQCVYVLAAHQSQKKGKALLNHAVSIVKGENLNTLWLRIRENNFRAINFYQRHGFRKFATHQHAIANYLQTKAIIFIYYNELRKRQYCF